MRVPPKSYWLQVIDSSLLFQVEIIWTRSFCMPLHFSVLPNFSMGAVHRYLWAAEVAVAGSCLRQWPCFF